MRKILLPEDRTPIQRIVDRYILRFKEKYEMEPVVNWPICTQILNKHLKNRSEETLIRIIDLYFEDENNSIYHLPGILCDYNLNKYLPKVKYDPRLYGNAEELNRDLT